MTNKKIEIDYQEFGSVQELEPQDRELCEAAEKALAGSYAPYSNFNVGAAVDVLAVAGLALAGVGA